MPFQQNHSYKLWLSKDNMNNDNNDNDDNNDNNDNDNNDQWKWLEGKSAEWITELICE